MTLEKIVKEYYQEHQSASMAPYAKIIKWIWNKFELEQNRRVAAEKERDEWKYKAEYEKREYNKLKNRGRGSHDGMTESSIKAMEDHET